MKIIYWHYNNPEYNKNGTIALPVKKDSEPSISLDSNTMTEIKRHNDLSSDGYLDESININGDSEFLKEFYPGNSYTSNKLGCGLYSVEGGCSWGGLMQY